MEIVREFTRATSRQVVIDIPQDFLRKELEILIIPVKSPKKVEKKKSGKNKDELFEKMCGLWEGREDITLERIRERAWKREQ